MRPRGGRRVLLVLAFALLTLATQIGGLALLLAVPAARRLAPRLGRARRAALPAAFAVVYGVVSLATVPLAGMAGRVPLPCFSAGTPAYKALSVWTCLLNRHYAAPSARETLATMAQTLRAAYPGRRLAYLDAGFPLLDGFPMAPHLSHRDGRKVDLAVLFADPQGRPAPGRARSPVGYWGYVEPGPGAPLPCAGRPSWRRWDLAWLQGLLPDLALDAPAMTALLEELAASPAVERILVEPHIAARLGVAHDKIRFQGCHAARHDDHVHVVFRRSPGWFRMTGQGAGL